MSKRSYGTAFSSNAAARLSKRRRVMRPSSTAQAAARLRGRSSLNRRTGGFIGTEKKFIDYEYIEQAVPATLAGSEADPTTVGAQTSVGCLNAVAQGDGESNRDGRKMLMKAIQINGVLQLGQTETTGLNSPHFVHIALVLDTQTNGAQLSAEQVFNDPTSALIDAYTFRNLQYASRFRVLASKKITLQSQIAASDVGDAFRSGAVLKPFSINKKLNMAVLHNGTTASVTNITDNSLHLICVRSTTQSGTGSVLLSYTSRLRFEG